MGVKGTPFTFTDTANMTASRRVIYARWSGGVSNYFANC